MQSVNDRYDVATPSRPRRCEGVASLRASVIFDARYTHIQAFFYYVPRRAQVQGRIEHVVRVCVYIRILLLLILKSRTLTTIIQRIERDVKKSGIMQQYAGTPGVKSNFRDYPGNSGRVTITCRLVSNPYSLTGLTRKRNNIEKRGEGIRRRMQRIVAR